MEIMKIAIIYHSEGGNTKKVAEIIAKGAQICDKIEVRTMSISNEEPDFWVRELLKK